MNKYLEKIASKMLVNAVTTGYSVSRYNQKKKDTHKKSTTKQKLKNVKTY